MRILAINYPKTERDNERLEKLTSSYESKVRAKVESEMNRSKVPDFDLLSKKRYQASVCKQLVLLSGRNSLFSLREP